MQVLVQDSRWCVEVNEDPSGQTTLTVRRAQSGVEQRWSLGIESTSTTELLALVNALAGAARAAFIQRRGLTL